MTWAVDFDYYGGFMTLSNLHRLPTFSTHGYNNVEIVANLIHMWLFS